MPPFTVEYLCPRQAPYWQPYREGLFFKTVRFFPDLQTAQMLCNSLIWQYHSSRVVDSNGSIFYEV